MVVFIAKIICEDLVKSNTKETKEMLVTKCVDTTESGSILYYDQFG